MPHHVALLGDSIFDNRSYTGGEPDVVTHVRALLPPPWEATLCAVDGATARGVPAQVLRVPATASHLVLSVGGNDALQNWDFLSSRVTSGAEALDNLAERLARFAIDYRAAIDAVIGSGRRVTVCTIYNGAFPPAEARITRVALSTFNDVIIQAAASRGIDVLDLRTVCTGPADYANPIEPSGTGGRKIARAIARAIEAEGSAPAETDTSAPAPSRIWIG